MTLPPNVTSAIASLCAVLRKLGLAGTASGIEQAGGHAALRWALKQANVEAQARAARARGDAMNATLDRWAEFMLEARRADDAALAARWLASSVDAIESFEKPELATRLAAVAGEFLAASEGGALEERGRRGQARARHAGAPPSNEAGKPGGSAAPAMALRAKEIAACLTEPQRRALRWCGTPIAARQTPWLKPRPIAKLRSLGLVGYANFCPLTQFGRAVLTVIDETNGDPS